MTTFNVQAAEKNLMQAIYAYSASRPTPLTPDNCQGTLSLSEDGQSLTFTTNDLAEVLAPMVLAQLKIEDFGSLVHLDQPGEDGEVAVLCLNYRHKVFTPGENGHDFANVRFTADGEIIEIAFYEQAHRERLVEDARYAKRFA